MIFKPKAGIYLENRRNGPRAAIHIGTCLSEILSDFTFLARALTYEGRQNHETLRYYRTATLGRSPTGLGHLTAVADAIAVKNSCHHVFGVQSHGGMWGKILLLPREASRARVLTQNHSWSRYRTYAALLVTTVVDSEHHHALWEKRQLFPKSFRSEKM